MAVAVNDMKVVSLLTAFFIDCFVGWKQNAPRGLVPAAHFVFLGGNKKVDPRREIDL